MFRDLKRILGMQKKKKKKKKKKIIPRVVSPNRSRESSVFINGINK